MQEELDDGRFLIDQREEIVLVTLNQPERLNAVTKGMLDGLEAAMERIGSDGARSLIVTGAGPRAFCAGTDLSEVATLTREEVAEKNDRARSLFQRLATSRFVSIAAVNGLAMGGGLELAAACSFRVAAPHAVFSVPEIKIGVIPTYGGTQRLPALVGRTRALDLLLTGRSVAVEEALSWGLVDRVAEEGTDVLDASFAFARSINCYSDVSIKATLDCVAAAGPEVTREGLDREAEVVRRVMRSYDAEEGVRAFLEKRPPRFEHR